jgi:hypothetical protein
MRFIPVNYLLFCLDSFKPISHLIFIIGLFHAIFSINLTFSLYILLLSQFADERFSQSIIVLFVDPFFEGISPNKTFILSLRRKILSSLFLFLFSSQFLKVL